MLLIKLTRCNPSHLVFSGMCLHLFSPEVSFDFLCFHRRCRSNRAPALHVLPHVLRLCQPRLCPSVPLENPNVEATVQVLSLVSESKLAPCVKVQLFQKVLVHLGWSLVSLHHVHVQRLLRPDRYGHRHPRVQVHRAQGVRHPSSKAIWIRGVGQGPILPEFSRPMHC